jgi:hypothetical protein
VPAEQRHRLVERLRFEIIETAHHAGAVAGAATVA